MGVGWMLGLLLGLAPSMPAHPKVVLVELFTSEGCSSCPPADALLRKIDGTRTADGQLIVGLSEHVTYWNSLGWADPFSAQTYTDRQNGYGASFGLDSVYTPQMVVNGRTQFVGSDGGGLERALRKEAAEAMPVELHILSVEAAKTGLTVRFSASGDGSAKGAEVYAVLADDVDQSSVLRGENSGRTLAHVAVARSIGRVGRLEWTEQTVQIPIAAAQQGRTGRHVVLFVQRAGFGRVLGVDTAAF